MKDETDACCFFLIVPYTSKFTLSFSFQFEAILPEEIAVNKLNYYLWIIFFRKKTKKMVLILM